MKSCLLLSTALLLSLFQLTFFSSVCESQASIPSQVSGRDAILLGTDWYPEQWPEAQWEDDLRLMEAANIKVVRIAEFAWSRMEPSQGHYDFAWLERAVTAAGRHHIAVVLGTPTAAPPAWLTRAHPDTLRVDEDGRRVAHGNRAHGSVSSPLYRQYCRTIAEQMARRFGNNPDVIGWQIDNEYGYALMSYDDQTRQSFQQWLARKYRSLDNLNARWTTLYWSQTYDSWDEIPIPVGQHNPGLMLEWKRFVTDSWNDYQKNQIEVIRQYAGSRQFITGNFMGFFDGFDHYTLAEPLTLAAWDDYVGTGHVDPDHNGLAHDLTRGFKRNNFWVIETQPGAVNWAGVNNFLNRGEVRAMAWQAVAHGADQVGYWQWRSALNGQEEYHGTLVGPDGTPVPLYDEIQQIGREFAAAQQWLRGTTVVSQVALLNSYESRWAIQFQKHHEKYDYVDVLQSYYGPLRRLAQSVDVISPDAPLGNYKLVVAPDLNVIPKNLADHLVDYVRNGGHLVLGPRSGMKDQYNALLPQRQPGYLLDALGARVEQYYALEKEFPVIGNWGTGKTRIWAEQLKILASDAQVIMRFGKSNGWLDDQPAVVTRRFDKGRITYIGAILDDKILSEAARWMVEQSGIQPVLTAVPDGIEVSRRRGGGNDVILLINFASESRRIRLPHPMTLILANESKAVLDLPPYGVELLRNTR